MHDVDAKSAQLGCWPDARQLQQLGRIDRAAAKNHLRVGVNPMGDAVLRVLECARTPALEHDAGRQGMRAYFEIRPVHGRAEVGVGGAATPTVSHRHVHPAETFLLEAVDVRGLRIAGLGCRRQPGGMQGIAKATIARLQLAVAAAVFIAAFLASFGAPEIRQHIAVRPTRCALAGPALEILRITADVHQAVDRRRSAQDLAARGMHAAPIQMRFRLRVIEPVVFRHVHRNRQGRRHLNEDGPVGAAVFQQQHPARTIRSEAIRKHAPGRTRAHDHKIEILVYQVMVLTYALRATSNGVALRADPVR